MWERGLGAGKQLFPTCVAHGRRSAVIISSNTSYLIPRPCLSMFVPTANSMGQAAMSLPTWTNKLGSHSFNSTPTQHPTSTAGSKASTCASVHSGCVGPAPATAGSAQPWPAASQQQMTATLAGWVAGQQQVRRIENGIGFMGCLAMTLNLICWFCCIGFYTRLNTPGQAAAMSQSCRDRNTAFHTH